MRTCSNSKVENLLEQCFRIMGGGPFSEKEQKAMAGMLEFALEAVDWARAYERSQNSLSSTNDDLSRYKKYWGDAGVDNEKLKREIGSLQEQINSHLKKLSSFNSEVVSSRGEVEKLESQLLEKEKERKELLKKNKQLRRSLRISRSELKILETQLVE